MLSPKNRIVKIILHGTVPVDSSRYNIAGCLTRQRPGVASDGEYRLDATATTNDKRRYGMCTQPRAIRPHGLEKPIDEQPRVYEARKYHYNYITDSFSGVPGINIDFYYAG